MKKPVISLIACIGRNRELGYENDLIWKIPDDMAYFKAMTKGHAIIMGQRTFESIGRALPGRTNIVLSDDANFNPSDVIVARTMDEALKQAKDKETDEIFFIGGAFVYSQSIKFADKIYLTIVDDEAQADAFFPEYSDFDKLEKKSKGSYKGIDYNFVILSK